MRESAVAERPADGSSGFPLPGLVGLVLAEAGADGWRVREDGFWCHVDPPEDTRRVQGWKLHVSATMLSAPEVLHRVARTLVEAGCAFKFAGRMDDVMALTSSRYDRAQCGKFITAYPSDDEQFRRLAERLHTVTAGLSGPAVLSDRRYREGSIVSYRYGAYDGVPVLTNDGVYATRLRRPDGVAVDDPRKPWFTPPAWAEPPFPEQPGQPGQPGQAAQAVRPAAAAKLRSVLLRDRYVVTEAIQHSSRGGVFRATDRQTGTEVVIKQAREYVGVVRDGSDARATLRHEAAMLDLLAGLGPDVVELFDQDGHTFLVETLVPGTVLAAWVHERFVRSAEAGVPLGEAIGLAGRLADLLGTVHGRGLVCRDFTPNNVMVGPEGQVRIIDPELIVHIGQWVPRSYTPGYVAPEYVTGPPYGPAADQRIDLYSLGAMLYYLVTGVHPGFAEDRPTRRPRLDRLRLVLETVTPHQPAARAFAPALLGLCADDPAQRWTLAQLREFLTELSARHDPTGNPAAGTVARTVAASDASDASVRGERFDRLVEDGLARLLATMNPNGARLWPSSAFGSETDPCNVQHGAAGVLAVLTRASDVFGGDELGTAVARVTGWLDDRSAARPSTLPGLYFGRSGTAWALFDAARYLGDEELAERVVGWALDLPVRWPNPDLFHGAAGAGLAMLHLWHATGRQQLLDRVVDCADGLVAAAVPTDDGPVWTVPRDFDSELAGIDHLGFAHGVAGVGTFLLAAAQVTGRAEYRVAAVAAGRTLAATAEIGPGGVHWRDNHAGRPGEGMLVNLCSGASGVGTFLLRLYRDTADERLRALVHGAAEAVHRSRWSVSSALCHGLAGNGDFLLDVAADLAGPYRDWAEDLADCLYARNVVRDGRLLVPDESGAEVHADYGVGLAGVVSFLLRLRHGGARPFLTG